MSRRSLLILAAAAAVLFVLAVLLRGNGSAQSGTPGTLLLPDFAEVADRITAVRIQPPESGSEFGLSLSDGVWGVDERGGYPADVARLRQFVVALADAKVVEEKTSNPEHYGKLGLGDPGAGGNGTRVTATGPEFSMSVILGNRAQRDKRYVRIDGEPRSYLADRELALEAAPGKWLRRDIVDVPATDVKHVTISHADGETVRIEKTDRQQTDFAFPDIPEGRELSYATVGNGIAGALGGLQLDDVRTVPEEPAEATSNVVFETWDGLRIVGAVLSAEDSAWSMFQAEATSDDAELQRRVDAINTLLSGWQYRIPEHKLNMLTRRWNDVLKTPETE